MTCKKPGAKGLNASDHSLKFSKSQDISNF